MHLFDEDKLKAVAYYRHSAEDKQENSVEIQREQVAQFAEREQIQIIDHFQDEGISGLTANRPGFQEMFSKWVTNLDAEHIDYILVYDASRFGRFQEMSEVWHWLGLCNSRGIKLATVTRGLPRQETSVMDSFVITLDFSMSGEYSKKLSDNVAHGSIKVAEQGFSAGGTAPYGYVRVLLSEQHERLSVLQQGQHKLISNQRVTFEPAKDGTAEIVKRIFNEFVTQERFPEDIAEGLNEDNIPTAKQRQWTASSIIRVLTNETYMGSRVYNKTWGRLKKKKRNNPSSEWVRCLNAHDALIDPDTFQKAQERLYWLRPRMRRQNSQKIHQIERYVERFIEDTIADCTDDQKHYARRYLPILFGATYLVGEESRVCFYVPPEYKKYETTLLCSVSLENDGGLENMRLFSLNEPSDNFVVLEDELNNSMTTKELKEIILELTHDTLEHHIPWLLSSTST